jgi:hypothetical protein
MTQKESIHVVELETLDEDAISPIAVGNPLTAADLAIDQSHMEEYATADEGPAEVTCAKPPKGVFFTVRAEISKRWQDRGFYFLLEMKDRDPFIVAPAIAKLKKEEDVIRPVLIVRYDTMAGEEGLWALKLDPPEGKSNSWNRSAMNVLKIADEGKWVRLISAKGRYGHNISRKTFEQTPPRFSSRSFQELINSAFREEQIITSLDHEVWDALENGSEK